MRNYSPLTTTIVLVLLVSSNAAAQTAPSRVVAWNDLGMHCIDPDFSVLAILPPFNNVNAQLLVNGKLATSGTGITLTYEAFRDANGSINTTSINKTNFWVYAPVLFGVTLPVDVGLTGSAMPGAANTPQPMKFDGQWNWLQGEGIPLTPIDDGLKKNEYPMMKITARDALNREIASTVTTLPVSDEINCRLCHASGASPFARPFSGWEFDPNPLKDDRLNILRLHDDYNLGSPTYTAALAKVGYNQKGLHATVTVDGKAILCAKCHGSNALPGTGLAGIPQLTHAMHGRHAYVVDPSGTTLDSITTRNSCYGCHPGQHTQCLRGAMGSAIGSDGKFAMECQSCHGVMSEVGHSARVGWFDQPACQNCHTGTATSNSGAIRYLTVFDSPGHHRQAASPVFATEKDVPKAPFSLYRFSKGHGGLQCSACHGPPHAIYPTTVDNDNVQNRNIQGHVGTLTDCRACHGQLQDSQLLGGPHGMHPVDQEWARGKHGDAAEKFGIASCQPCHGTDYRGTVLSWAKGDRTVVTEYGTKSFFRGARVGCYHCHNGPNSEQAIRNAAPVVPDDLRSTPNDVPLKVVLKGTDANLDPLSFRIVDQPRHGTVGLVGTDATYFPAPGYVGQDAFTYAAWDGKTNSNLGSVKVTVNSASCPGSATPYGFGSPGTGGILPQLTATGCASPGKSIRLSLEKGLGGSSAFLLLGTQRSVLELWPGCVLRVAPVFAVSPPIPLVGSGPGNGAFSLNVLIPPATLPGTRITAQVAVIDPGALRGLSASNGLDVDVR